jgi:hypothetical protein
LIGSIPPLVFREQQKPPLPETKDHAE